MDRNGQDAAVKWKCGSELGPWKMVGTPRPAVLVEQVINWITVVKGHIDNGFSFRLIDGFFILPFFILVTPYKAKEGATLRRKLGFPGNGRDRNRRARPIDNPIFPVCSVYYFQPLETNPNHPVSDRGDKKCIFRHGDSSNLKINSINPNERRFDGEIYYSITRNIYRLFIILHLLIQVLKIPKDVTVVRSRSHFLGVSLSSIGSLCADSRKTFLSTHFIISEFSCITVI